jgi:thiamine pyrophosphate-dependent acetolactate synthase large subunit-like protein
MTCGEALVRLLEQYGVDIVFGIPGVHTLDLYRGLANSNVRHVQARHEQGAGFMADGYARVSGRPGVCMLITGPGVTNAATALGQAYADSMPVLLISSVTPTYTLGKGWGCLHEITDQQAVTAPLTALSVTALASEDLPELVGQAFAIFESARPRPVHIAIPTDVLGMTTEGHWSPRIAPSRPRPDPAAVQAAAKLLAQAERPAIVVGGGAIGAGEHITAIAESIDAGIISSNAGKGVVPDSHYLNLSASIWRTATQDYLARADVILAIGTELSETDSFVERLALTGKLVRVDIDPGKINDLYPADIGIQADATATARALLTAINETISAKFRRGAGETIASVQQQVMAGLSPVEQQHATLLARLRKVLPEDAVVMADIAQLVYTGSFALPVEQPRCWHYPAGYCTLGCALPGAIGAKLAVPERPVIVLAGDGGFMFTVQELATAVELELSLPIIVWNNDGLGQIRDDMKIRDIPPIGVNSRNPDFVALARAFGCRGLRPDSPDMFEAAVAEALQAQVPTLIEVHEGAEWLSI